jgi:hypothetical protein
MVWPHAERVTIGDRGQLVLPRSLVRSALGLKPGTGMLLLSDEPDGSLRELLGRPGRIGRGRGAAGGGDRGRSREERCGAQPPAVWGQTLYSSL